MADSTWMNSNNTNEMGNMNMTQTKYEIKTCTFHLK